MTSYLPFGILSCLISQYVWGHQAYFYPGTATSFDFFDRNPDFKTYGPYVKYCVQRQCDLSVFHNFRQAVTTTSTSTFTVSAATHEGSYTLTVKSGDIGFIIPHILNITAAYLCMQKPEVYLSRALPPVYKRGRVVVVPCPVLGAPQPTVTWRKRAAGGSIVDIASDNDKYIITQLGHLFISDFSDSDVGFYSCSAKNDCGERCSADSECTKISAQGADYELKIQDEDEKPSDKLKYYFLNPSNVNCWTDSCFSYSKMNNNVYMYLKPNENANVEVFADIHSNSTYVGYRMITQETSPRFISYSDKVCYGVLQNYTNKDVLINSVNCGAYNKFNLMSLSTARYKLAITEPPHIELISSQKDIVEYGSNFSIEFKITKGHKDYLHTPMNIIEVTCFKNGESFLLEKGWHKQCMWNKTTNIVTISIICATDTDTGYYQVMVRNWSGSNISNLYYVETYPHDESSRDCFSLRHTVLSSRSVRLEWDRPNSNLTTPLIYEIVVKNLAWKEELDRSHTVKLTAVVEKLHPGTPYNAHVQSKSDLVGHRIRFKTHEERPSAPPANVNCEPQYGSTWLYCVWDEIPLQQRNGDITSYKVKYKLHYEWSFNFTSVGYIHIADLEPCAEYAVQVMGCTAVGCGSHEELSVKTLEDRPNYRPTLRYTISGTKNIRIGWVRPAGSFKNIFYTVNCKEQDTGTHIFSKNITDVDAVISGQSIKPSTHYVVSITPESSQGFGPTLTKEVSTLSGSLSIRSSFLLFFLSVLIVLILIDF